MSDEELEVNQDLLEPLKLYAYELKYKHEDNVDAFFDELTSRSGVNIEENRSTCKDYYGYLKKIENAKKQKAKKKAIRGLLIFLTVICFLAALVMIFMMIGRMLDKYIAIFLPISLFLILVGVGAIVLNCTVIKRGLRDINQILDGLNAKANKILSLAQDQMRCLNNLYDWNIPSSLVTKTTPLIQMDKNFGVERLYHMIENYGFKPNDDEHLSSVFVQSGKIIGNPFIIERDYLQTMVPHTYTGSIVITWTTYSTDSKGRTYPVHHTQTLRATVTKPAAHYALDTCLFYANEAAPRLSFSRTPSNANRMSERDVEKLEREYDRKFAKAQKGSFTPLGNSKFEGLFHAFDRDNEVEFRLLFTPLAQKNMLSLILSKEPYGDDFRFIKRKQINLISSSHAQTMKFDGNPSNFYSFDYDKAKANFKNYNMNYFKAIFYDLAPLLSISLYQQHRDYDYEYKGTSKSYHTPYEAEVLANFFDPNHFVPEDCDTPIILKAHFVSKIGKGVDLFNIVAHGFNKIPQVEFVTKLGGDGLMHTIPVDYYEYEPVEKTTPIVVMDLDASKQEARDNLNTILQVLSPYMVNNDIIIQRGLCSFVARDGINHISVDELNKLFSHKEA